MKKWIFLLFMFINISFATTNCGSSDGDWGSWYNYSCGKNYFSEPLKAVSFSGGHSGTDCSNAGGGSVVIIYEDGSTDSCSCGDIGYAGDWTTESCKFSCKSSSSKYATAYYLTGKHARFSGSSETWVDVSGGTAKPKTYTVVFDANDGNGTMSNQQIIYNTIANLTANSYSKTNYSFAGWNTKSDGTGTSYSDKQPVKNLTSAGGTLTLYAQWVANYNVYQMDAIYNGNNIIQNSTTITSGTNYTIKTIKFCKKTTDTTNYTIGVGKNFKSLGTQAGTSGCAIIK